jgi:site-specific DNA-methyltransferase (adenine-specific)
VKPYYDEDGITIYHGDCRDVLPHVSHVDLVLTDPPYGIDGARGLGGKRMKGDYSGGFEDTAVYIRDVVVPVVIGLIQRATCVVVTPGNANFAHYPQPDSFGVFYQPAAVGLQPFGNVDAQPILYYGTAGGGRMGKPCSFVLTETPERNGHPCPKPFKAWKKLLATVARPGQQVLDPFMGSGTTLVVAKQMGHAAIGIELNEAYCEIAANRLAQGALPLEATA